MYKVYPTTFRQLIIYSLLIIGVLISAVANAASITVTSSRNPVAIDDSFHLIYEANSSVDEDPDFTPIYEHFDILSSSQSTNMRSVNGSWDLKKTWNLTLIAKDIGIITIPSIKFGTDSSPAIKMNIVNNALPNTSSSNNTANNATNKQATVPDKIFLESTVNKASAWVQSQIVYSVKLLRTVSMTGATLSELKTSDPDAIIKIISEDNFQTTRNGIRYEVFERRYAIYPQKSGTLIIDPVIFDGRINATQARSIFDQFRMTGQRKRLRSQAININVKPAPPSINLQNWLPARDLKLVEEWSSDIQNLKAGEPVTRTIMIAAEGVTGVQLPDISLDEINGLKQYPDKAIIEDKPSGTGVVGYKQIKIALIPAEAGSYTLPEITLQWWNTKTNKKEIARLPETTINVTGSAPTFIPAPPIVSNVPNTLVEPTHNKPNNLATSQPYWKWLTLMFATFWLLTLILYFRKPRSQRKPPTVKNHAPVSSIKSAASAVKKAARTNHAKNTKTALIKWASVTYLDKNLTNLSQIGKHCSPQLNSLIQQLNEHLYSTEKSPWNGQLLLTAFKSEQFSKPSDRTPKTSTLKPLYKK